MWQDHKVKKFKLFFNVSSEVKTDKLQPVLTYSKALYISSKSTTQHFSANKTHQVQPNATEQNISISY